MNRKSIRMKKFLASYRHDNADWSFEFYALDMEDAKVRFEKIKEFGRFDGEICLKIPMVRSKIFEKVMDFFIYAKGLLFQK